MEEATLVTVWGLIKELGINNAVTKKSLGKSRDLIMYDTESNLWEDSKKRKLYAGAPLDCMSKKARNTIEKSVKKAVLRLHPDKCCKDRNDELAIQKATDAFAKFNATASRLRKPPTEESLVKAVNSTTIDPFETCVYVEGMPLGIFNGEVRAFVWRMKMYAADWSNGVTGPGADLRSFHVYKEKWALVICNCLLAIRGQTWESCIVQPKDLAPLMRYFSSPKNFTRIVTFNKLCDEFGDEHFGLSVDDLGLFEDWRKSMEKMINHFPIKEGSASYLANFQKYF